MARVVVTFRVMPTGPDTDLVPIEEALRASFGQSLRALTENPVAFGLVGLETVILLEDAEGTLEAAEGAIRGVPGVASVEVLSVDLV